MTSSRKASTEFLAPHKVWLTPTHAARILRVHRRTLDRHTAAGRLHRDPVTRKFALHELLALNETEYQLTREALITQLAASHSLTPPPPANLKFDPAYLASFPEEADLPF